MEQSRNTEGIENNANIKSTPSKLRLVINILTVVIIVLSVVFLGEALYADRHLHNNYFGYAVLPVASKSMQTGKKDEIRKGDLIFVRILDEEGKRSLSVGDIITFKYPITELDSLELVTHRIMEVHSYGYTTRGDANLDSYEEIAFNDIVGVYAGKLSGVGSVGLFFETKAGSFVMIVVPFLLLLLLSIFHFVKSFRLYSGEKLAAVKQEARSELMESERERLRQEILLELEKAEGASAPDKDKEFKEKG